MAPSVVFPRAVCTWAHLLLLLLSHPVLAYPFNTSLSGDISLAKSWDLKQRQNADKPFLLRIMPLGASITAGEGTTPPNGYRKPLRDQLRWRGWPVNMVGSLVDGGPEKFHNRQHEGHRGYVVNQMIEVSNYTIPRKPNVVLINCGTNDADPITHQIISTTGQRMEAVLNHLYLNIEGVTVILSTLIPRKDAANANVTIINEKYRTLAQQFAGAGKKIVMAEFNNGFLDTDTDYADNIHPNERGAAKLAAVWDQAILEAENKGFLTAPIDTGIPDYDVGDDNSDTHCDVTLGSGRGPVRTQVGFGFDDGLYIHAEADIHPLNMGSTRIPPLDFSTASLAFVQLVNVNNVDPGGERDDLVLCTDTGPGQVPGPCQMLLNVDGGFPNKIVILDTGLKCLARGVRWGDVNGDGLDDFICINLQGNMYVAINQGDNPPTFVPTGNGGLIREGEPWGGQDRVRLADMDGDGRLDYCAIDDKGDIYCWRNGGVGLAPTEAEGGYWQGLVGGEPTFYAQHEAEGIGGVHLVDINGDHRADWVYVYNDGSTKIFINQRGTYDEDGKGLRPHWARAQKEHAAIPLVTNKNQVFFGRVEASGRADRIATSSYDLAGGLEVLLFDLFPNRGAGGTKRKGDGVFYCDMFGRGYDDYLWVLSTGEITLFENIQSPPNWGQHGVIIDIERPRKSIHFGDWDGDGLCDILAVERHTGRVEWWRNTYKQGAKSPTFDSPKWAVDTDSNLCGEGWGWGLYDQGLRFADLDGDKRVDYLCMGKDGRTVGQLNKANGLEYKGQIKFAPAERLDRANFKWADINGDGLTDLIWVDKYAAGARVWKNGGFIPAGGSSMTWIDQGFRFEGHGRGQNIHFPTLGTKHRADYHDVYPGTGIANTWFNECRDIRAGEGEDDYPTPINPGLPTPPGGGGGGGAGSGNMFSWGSIGDSWASGVSWDGAKTDYDGNAFGCLRLRAAYEPQMAEDDRWTDLPQDFHFGSCSGARMSNMAKDDAAPGHPGPQIADVGTPAVLTMEVGGNNCDFGHIVEVCFVQPSPTRYGADYPDPAGMCGEGFQNSLRYIQDRGATSGFYFDYLATLRDVLAWPTIRDNPDFRLYLLGYAHFFNAETDWCDDISFRYIQLLTGQKLTKQLRRDTNNAMDMVHQAIRDAIAEVGDPRVKFIDINPLYEGHRFCEDGHTFYQQWYHNDIWLWNLNHPSNDFDNNPTAASQDLEINFGEDAQGNPIVIPETDDIWEYSSGGLPPWVSRSFHPRSSGHQAAKRAVIAQMRADGVSGVKQLSLPSSPPFNQGTCTVHLTQKEACTSVDLRQVVSNVTVQDAAGNGIGSLIPDFQSGDRHPVLVRSKIDTLLGITTVDQGNNVQFDLQGRSTWRSDDSSRCTVGNWADGKPGCGQPGGSNLARPITCTFQCNWNGGQPTDSY